MDITQKTKNEPTMNVFTGSKICMFEVGKAMFMIAQFITANI